MTQKIKGAGNHEKALRRQLRKQLGSRTTRRQGTKSLGKQRPRAQLAELLRKHRLELAQEQRGILIAA